MDCGQTEFHLSFRDVEEIEELLEIGTGVVEILLESLDLRKDLPALFVELARDAGAACGGVGIDA